MKSAEEIILEIEELPKEERQKVEEYLISSREGAFKISHYSPEDMAKLNKDQEESKKRIDTIEFSSMAEARKFLRSKC